MITYICIIACYDGNYEQNAFAFEVGSGLLIPLKIPQSIDLTKFNDNQIELLYSGYDLYIIVEDSYVRCFKGQKERLS